MQPTQLVRRDRSSQTEQPQLQPANIHHSGRDLIEHMQVLHLVLARSELLQDPHVLDQTPDREDRDGEGDRASEEVGELREREVDGRLVQCVDQGRSTLGGRNVEKRLAGERRDQGRVSQEVLEDSTTSASDKEAEGLQSRSGCSPAEAYRHPMLLPGRYRCPRSARTHLSPMRSRLSALMKPKSPVWMTAVASCSRISLFSSWSGVVSVTIPSSSDPSQRSHFDGKSATELARADHSQSPLISATQRIRPVLPARTTRGVGGGAEVAMEGFSFDAGGVGRPLTTVVAILMAGFWSSWRRVVALMRLGVHK